MATERLDPHQREVAARLSQLLERSQLRQRVTMSYDPQRVGEGRGAGARDVTDSVADARKQLARLASALPRECWGVLVDTCLYEKGLQQIETERGWPRRSAKLVLRIGLDHVGSLFGMDAMAKGPEGGPGRSWLPERPPMFSPLGDER